MSEGVFSPPEGLTMREQARWWASHPIELEKALASGRICLEAFAAIWEVGEDNALAHKITDSHAVKGLSNEERGRLFSRLTDGSEWLLPKLGASSKAVTDLSIALLAEHSEYQHSKSQEVRNLIKLDSGHITSGAVDKREKRIEKLWESFRDYDHAVICSVLRICMAEKQKLTEKQLHCVIQAIELVLKNTEINTPPL